MNIKYKIRILTWLALLLLVITGCNYEQSIDFTISPEEALQKITAHEYLISFEEFTTMIKDTNDNVLVIDLRSPTDFGKGYLADAINIPLTDLLNDESFSLLSNSSNTVLYSHDVFEASGPAMLLTQLGLENVKVLNTGYEGCLDTFNISSPELARYDYALTFQKAVEQHNMELRAATKPILNPQPVKAKKSIKPDPKKKKELDEGC